MTTELKFAPNSPVAYNGFWNGAQPELVVGVGDPYSKQVRLTGRSYNPQSFSIKQVDTSIVTLTIVDKVRGILKVRGVKHGKKSTIIVACGQATAKLVVYTRQNIYKKINFFRITDKRKTGKKVTAHKPDPRVNEMYSNLNRIVFPQCYFWFMKGKVIPESTELDLTDKSGVTEADVIAEFKKMATKHGSNTGDWNVFFVETYTITDTAKSDTRGWNLGGGGPNNTGWCLLDDKPVKASPVAEHQVFAHEAGHFLGAGHYNQNDSLMHENTGLNRLKLHKASFDEIVKKHKT